jgi:hypothetical protein
MTNPAQKNFIRSWLAGIVFATCVVSASANPPDLRVDAKAFPHDDAVIVQWDQHWTLSADGTTRVRDHQWIKLFNRRPIRRVADRTIDYHGVEDEVIVHAARAHLPDGEVIAVPDYGFNLGATPAIAGWPAFAAWKQRIISFSGVQPGATLELDYEIITRSGVYPALSDELRLDGRDPIVRRSVSITRPAGVALHWDFTNIVEPAPESRTEGDALTETWTFGQFPGDRNAAHAPDWRERCPRMRWSTSTGADTWVAGWREPVRAAVRGDDAAIVEFAREATADAFGVRAQLEALHEKLHARFAHLDARAAWRDRACRNASEVFESNYGNPLEYTALLMSMLHALDLEPALAVAVDARTWNAKVPTDDAFAGLVAAVDGDGDSLRLHPAHGLIENPGAWGDHILLYPAKGAANGSRTFREEPLHHRGAPEGSAVELTGRIELAEDGTARGELRVQLTGAFFDPADLDSDAGQRRLLAGFVSRALADFKVERFAVEHLATDRLRAKVHVETSDPIAAAGDHRVLRMGDGPLLLERFSLPLADRNRTQGVALVGPIRERLDLVIERPEGCAPAAWPSEQSPMDRSWGSSRRSITVDANSIRIHRQLETSKSRLTAGEYAGLRAVINAWRTDGGRAIVLPAACPTDAD